MFYNVKSDEYVAVVNALEVVLRFPGYDLSPFTKARLAHFVLFTPAPHRATLNNLIRRYQKR
ncbi:hypothetical protein [Stenotrophomonas maltophilia]|uniref:hypothetical protein n=1 Tax=Stenotrophomonas maltophilia TaxID=40324 RepID=UPI0031B933EF|nr:hypothetical protein [Stenotrophomonas maltophilia]